MATQVEEAPEHLHPPHSTEANDDSQYAPRRLSPILEETDPSEEDNDSRSTWLRLFYQHDDPNLQKILDRVLVDERDGSECVEPRRVKPFTTEYFHIH